MNPALRFIIGTVLVVVEIVIIDSTIFRDVLDNSWLIGFRRIMRVGIIRREDASRVIPQAEIGQVIVRN